MKTYKGWLFCFCMKGRVDGFGIAAGAVLVILGVVLLVVSFFVPFLIFYALVVLVIGIVILATLKEQERIDPIRERGGHSSVADLGKKLKRKKAGK